MNEFKLRDKLKEDRENIKSFDELISFLQNVKENCNYGYGEAPRAIAQAALATAWYLSSEFGITGFQASFVMWDFILDWQYRNNKCGLKMIDYDDMLYPQYEHKFEKTLSTDTFEALQKEASKLFEDSKGAHQEVIKHWKSIVDGKVPFGYMLRDR